MPHILVKIKRLAVTLLLTAVFVCVAGGNRVSAMDLNAVVAVVTGYEFGDGSLDVWGANTGVYLGDGLIVSASKGIVYDNLNNLDYQGIIEKKQQNYIAHNIDLNNFESVAQSLKTYIIHPDGRKIDVELTRFEHELGLVLYTAKTAGLNLSSASVSEFRPPTSVTATYYQTNMLEDAAGKLGNGMSLLENFIAFEENVSCITRDNQLEATGLQDNFSLGAVLNMEKDVYGIITESSGGIKYSVTGKDILAFILGNTPSSISLTFQIEALEGTLSNAKSLDLTGYTETSINVLKEAVAAAEAVLATPAVTEKQVQDAKAVLDNAVDGLTRPTRTSLPLTLYALVAFVFILFGFVIWFFLLRGKKKSEAKKPENSTKNQAQTQKAGKKEKKPSTFKMFIDTMNKRQEEKDSSQNQGYGGEFARSAKKSQYVALEALDDEAGTTKLNTDSSDTTILKKQKESYLEVTATQERIELKDKPIIIGREKKKVNYQINLSSISRTHCVIRPEGDEYFVEDLQSANGTYLNGEVVDKNSPLKLKDCDILMLADQEIIFHQE